MKKISIALMLVVAGVLPATPAKAHEETKVVLPRMSERRNFQLSMKFVNRLAKCETNGDWKNGGKFAGGLGIAWTTWVQFGGREFGWMPNNATKKEQIIVANRIALWGYTHSNGRFAYPVGVGGWGGLRCALPFRLERRRIGRSTAFSAHETGDPYAVPK